MRRTSLLLLLLFGSCALWGQQKYGQPLIDSLQHELQVAKEDTNKVKILYTLSFNYYQVSPDSGIKYGGQGVGLAQRLKWEKGIAQSNNSLGVNYQYKANYPKALECYQKALEINEKIGNTKGMSQNLNNMGMVYEYQSNYPKALELHFKSLKINEELNYKKGEASNFVNIGNVYLAQKDYGKALTYHTQSAKIYEELGDSNGIAGNIVITGAIYLEQNNPAKALEYYLKVLGIYKRSGNKLSEALVLKSIGKAYRLQKDYSKALEYSFMALQLNKGLGNKKAVGEGYANIGLCYFEIAEQKNGIKPGKDIPATREANLAKAITNFESAIQAFREIGELDQLQDNSESLAKAYTLSGNYKKALEYYQQFIVFKDSVFSSVNKIKLADIEARREMDLETRDIQLANKQIEIEKLKRSNANDEDVIFIIGIGLLLLIIAGLTRNYIMQRKLAKEKLDSNEHKFRSLIEHNADAVAIIGPDRKPTYVSPTVKAILGYTDKEAMDFDIFAEAHPDDAWIVMENVGKVMASPGVSVKSPPVRMKHKDGHWVWTDATLTNMLHDPVINGVIDNFRDVTEQKEAEEKILQLNRLYAFISQINQSIVRDNDEQTLFKKVCDIAVEFGNFDMAIIGSIDEVNRKFNYEAGVSNCEIDIEALCALPYSEKGLLKRMLETGNCAFANDYSKAPTTAWKEYTWSHGFKSTIMLPLKKSGKIEYGFMLFSKTPDFFNTEEQALLEEAAYDVSFALDVFEKEKQRKLMEDELIKNEARLKQAQAIAHLGSWELDFSTGIAEWSEEMCRIFGMPIEHNKHSYESWLSFVHPDDVDFVLNKRKETEGIYTDSGYNYRILRRDGTTRYIFRYSHYELNSEGLPIAMYGVTQDVTEQQEIQTKIIQNELRLKQAQSIAHVGSWELNFSTGIAEWSEEACRIYGLEPTDNLHSYASWESFIHPEDLGYVLDVIKKGRDTLSKVAFYHRIIRADGVARHIYSQSEFIFDKEGKPMGLHGAAHDVTEMKEAGIALAQSEANLRMIMDLIPQSIFAKNYDGKYVFINKAFATLYGLTTDELTDKFIYDTIPVKDESDSFLKQDREVILSGKTKVIPEQTFTNAEGNQRLFHTIKVPFTVAGTNERAVLGIATDITAQKNAEAERLKIIGDIVQRNKNLEQFSYIVSHNLRAPVANIMALSDLLQIKKHGDDQEVIFMRGLASSVKKLDEVIRDLNYVLQVKHQVNEKKEHIKLSQLCSDIQLSISNLLSREDVKIIIDFSEVDEILTLKSYLYSIFFNLISNSIKYHQPDVPPIIEIKSIKHDKSIELVFTDNGLGIDLERKSDQVFGLYKRFHDHTEGKGMGLFMVKTQVETLGGKITIASKVNAGTTFRITFENN